MYDLHNHLLPKTSSEELERFKFKNFGVIFSSKEKFDLKKFSELKKQSPFNLFSGIEIHASRSGEVKSRVDKYRKQVDFVMVHASDQRAIRAAAENKYVDVIAHAFIDQTAAREAGKNKVAIEINLKDILSIYRMKRAVLLSKIKFNLDLARKYKIPLILSTGAY
jgi:ribonuclease P/MRP protein subunit RPP1